MTRHIHLRVLGSHRGDVLHLGKTCWGNYTCCQTSPPGGCAITVFRDQADAEGYAATMLDPQGERARRYWRDHEGA